MKPLTKLVLGSALFFTLSGPSIAQVSKNVTLLGRFNRYSRYNDVWGFEGNDGKEYCLLGVSDRISLIDISTPSKPTEVASFRGKGASTWRDVKYYNGYAYAVTERSSEGMMIIDLRVPSKPRFVKFWDGVGFRHSHNIAMDFQRGHAYLVGCTGGTWILDVKTNPTTPKKIGNIRSPYFHDVAIQDKLMHAADIYGNNYRIYDVTNPALPKLLGSARAPGTRYFHNTWPTRDNQYCLGTNESPKGPVSIWDIRKLSAPKNIANYRANPLTAANAIAHNAYCKDRVGHISHYTEGYRVIDLSNPATPVEVGFYDTWSGSSSGYNGNWGAMPPLDSGICLINDISTGLYVCKSKAAARYYGKGTKGTAGRLPEIHHFGAAYLGNRNFAIQLENAKPRSAGVLVIGGKASNTTVSGLQILVDLANPPAILFTAGTSALGEAKLALPLPSDPKLSASKIFAQWLVVDSGASSSLGFAASRGMNFELFLR